MPYKLPTFTNATRPVAAFLGASGGRPSYFTASSASLSKFGTSGVLWKADGLYVVNGFESCAMPSMKTCLGVAPSARGWLSQMTRS